MVVACLLVAGCSSPARSGSDPSTGPPPIGSDPSTGVPPIGGAPVGGGSVSGGSVAGSRQPSGVSSGARSGSSGLKRGVSSVAVPRGFSTFSVVPRAPAGCAPTVLKVPSVGIDEDVHALGLNAQGQIYPPRRTTMWYTGSAVPGQDGISVIAGHVTYDGPDNFYHLINVAVGSSVSVQCASGALVRLRVVRTTSILKTRLQTDQSVWGSSPTPVVVLITCDPNSPVVTGHHLNNFIAWTTPL